MKFTSTFLFTLMILLTKDVTGGGLDYNTTFGTKTFTLNGLYFAGNPGLSSIYSNPAGLLFINGTALELSVINRVEQIEFESSARGLFKSYRNENYSVGGGLSFKLSDDITIGAAYHPVIDYKADWPFVVIRSSDTSSSVLAFGMMNRLEIYSISPSAAFRFGDLTVGLTANIYQTVHQLSFPRSNTEWGQNSGLAAYQFNYDLNGWGFGGTLGILYNAGEDLRVGLTAKSGFKVDLNGDANSRMYSDINSAASDVGASAELDIPWKFGLGFLYKLSNNINVNIDAAYNLWGSTGEQLTFTFEDQVWQNRLSEVDSLSGFVGNSIPLFYDNSFDFGIGIEHFTEGGLIYRGGYRFSQSPNSAATFSFLFPSVDQHIISFGIGYKDQNLTLEAGIAYTLGIAETVGQSENRYLFGEYSSDSYIPSLTIRYDL